MNTAQVAYMCLTSTLEPKAGFCFRVIWWLAIQYAINRWRSCRQSLSGLIWLPPNCNHELGDHDLEDGCSGEDHRIADIRTVRGHLFCGIGGDGGISRYASRYPEQVVEGDAH